MKSISFAQQSNPLFDEEVESGVSIELAARVILFNDDWHTFEEVIEQLVKALSCNFDAASVYAYEAHVKGKAVVFSGDMPACLKVSGILEEIALHTQIVT